jgi:hypothetical protein
VPGGSGQGVAAACRFRKSNKRSLGLALVFAATLMAAPAAVAKPGYFVWPGQQSSELTVKGTQDFKVTIARSPRYVELNASNGDTAAIYIVRAAKGPMDIIEARFPGLGRVSLRFHPRGDAEHESPFFPCKGRGSIKQNGVFRGVIRFRGEEGFTRVAATRASGFLYRSFRQVCKGGSDSRLTSPLGYSLAARERSPGRLVRFSAFRATEDPFIDGHTHHFAHAQERRDGMRIARVAVTTEVSPSTFAVEGLGAPPRSATVAPPSPFSGTASFDAPSSGPVEWRGTLAVELPGLGVVPLAGPSFEAELCLNKRCSGALTERPN